MEEDPDLEEIGSAELDRVIRIPKFFVSAPTRWELKASVRWEEGVPPEEVYIGGQVGQRIHAPPAVYHPGDFFDLFEEGIEREAGHTPELSALEHQEILRNIERAGEGSRDETRQDDGIGGDLGMSDEGDWQQERSLGRTGIPGLSLPDACPREGVAEELRLEEEGVPRYLEMTAYVDGLVQMDGPEDSEAEGATGELTEGEVLDYQWVTQRAQGLGAYGPLQGLMEADMAGDPHSDSTRGVNLLDWTVRDQAETSMDYDLGEIANRSFQDRYGIWAGQEEIFPEWGARDPEEPGALGRGGSGGDIRKQEELRRLSHEEGAGSGASIRPVGFDWTREVKEVRTEECCPPSVSGNSGGIAPWAASAYLRAMAEERSRAGPWEEEPSLLLERDRNELAEGSVAWESPQVEGLGPEEARVDVGEGDFLSSTQIGGHEEARIFGNREGRALSPIGPRSKGPRGREPRFIVDLYQDEDRRFLAIGKMGGLTFWHSEEGNIDVLEHDGSSSIPARYPPMNDSTLDWSLLGKRHSPADVKAERRVWKKGARAQEEETGPVGRTDLGADAPKGSGGALERRGIKIRKGRYSKKSGKKGHRGGRKKANKRSPLPEEDSGEGCRLAGNRPMTGGLEPEPGGEESGIGHEVRRLTEPGEDEDAGRRTTEDEEEDAGRGTSTDEEEDPGEKTASRTKKTGSRRRTHLVTVKEGRLLHSDKGPKRNGRAPSRMSQVWPRRDEIITPGMSDPNRNIIGYRSQEVPVASARTSGVFWATSKTRDNRRFPGTAEKTLHRQGLEYVSVEGAVGGEEEDPLLWPGVRPPEAGPR